MKFYNRKKGLTKEIRFREFRDEDAYEVVCCLNDAYGGTYVKPYLYSEEEIIELNNKHKLVFTIAENPTAGVVGILGNEESTVFTNQNEFVTQVIKKDFKGYGIAKAHISYNLKHYSGKGYDALYGYALGSHVISQITFTQLGFTACGFMLSVFDQDTIETAYERLGNAKISQAVILLDLIKDKRPKIYIVDPLVNLIKSTYQQLDALVDVCTTEQEIELAESQLRITNNDQHHMLTIYVSKCGMDFEGRVDEIIKEYGSIKLQTINLFLNMEDEGAIYGYTILHRKGFFFTGIHPSGSNFEYMIMHHPLGVTVDMNEVPYIEAYQPYVDFIEKEIIDYVQR